MFDFTKCQRPDGTTYGSKEPVETVGKSEKASATPVKGEGDSRYIAKSSYQGNA